MKKIITLFLIVSFIAAALAACKTAVALPASVENPGKGPELSVTIPELFSPNPDIADDKMTIKIDLKHPAPIKDWKITIQPVRNTTGQAAAGGSQRADGQQRQPRAPFFEVIGTGNPPKEWQWNGKSSRPTGEIVTSASAYRFVLSVNDNFDNSTEFEGEIHVDVLVRREGNDLRIIVPSIVFPANLADLNRVTNEDDVRSNRRVLRLIANALSKYPDYSVTVEGHANPTTPEGTQRNNELAALRRVSNDRASAVIDYLVANHNINRQRLRSVGIGGERTVAAYDDTEENWKNRRVEFLLHK